MLKELRRDCEMWMDDVSDMRYIPEKELINIFWPDKIQPLTDNPVFYIDNAEFRINYRTKVDSIGKKRIQDYEEGLGWHFFKSILDMDQETTILVIAHRFGFAPSDTLK